MNCLVSFSIIGIVVLVTLFSLSVETLQYQECNPVNAIFLWDSTRNVDDNMFEMGRNTTHATITRLQPGSNVKVIAIGGDNNDPITVLDKTIPDPSLEETLYAYERKITSGTISAKNIQEIIDTHFDKGDTPTAAEEIVFFPGSDIFIPNITDIENIHKKKTTVVYMGQGQPSNSWKQMAASSLHMLHIRDDSELDMIQKNINDLICRDSHLQCDTDKAMIPNHYTCRSCDRYCISTIQKNDCKWCPYYGLQPVPTQLYVMVPENNAVRDVAIIFSVVAGIIILAFLIILLCYFHHMKRCFWKENNTEAVQECDEPVTGPLLTVQPDEINLHTNGGVPRDDGEDVSENEGDDAIGDEIDVLRGETTEGEYATDGLSIDSVEAGRDSGVDTAKGSALSVTEIRLVTENENAFEIPMTNLQCEGRLPPVTDGYATALADGEDLCSTMV